MSYLGLAELEELVVVYHCSAIEWYVTINYTTQYLLLCNTQPPRDTMNAVIWKKEGCKVISICLLARRKYYLLFLAYSVSQC